jgi:hypothetical protein
MAKALSYGKRSHDDQIYQSYTSARENETIGNNMDIRLKLIYHGVLPATSDFYLLHDSLVKKYPKIFAVAHIYHEKHKKPIIYNKNYKNIQKMIKNCQSKKDNHIAFGKLIGFLEGLNFNTMNRSKEVIGVRYTLNEKKFFGFWKSKKNTDMKKELSLLTKMRYVDERIKLEIDFELV